jgi:competence protein ComEC
VNKPESWSTRKNFLVAGRPAFLMLIAFALGIVAERSIASGDIAASILLGFFSFLILLNLLILTRRNPLFRITILLIGVMVMGFSSSALLNEARSDSALYQLSSLKLDNVTIHCKVESPPVAVSSGMMTICDVRTLSIDSTTVNAPGKILLTLLSDSLRRGVTVHEGDLIKIEGRLEPFQPPSNPHESSREFHIRDKYGVQARMTLVNAVDCQILGTTGSVTLWQGALDWGANLRSSAQDELAKAIDDKETLSFVEAVVLGERTDISEETLSDFTRSGVSHILAVSGFNVAIIAAAIAQLLRLFGFRRRGLRTLLAMACVAMYCLIVGFEPSVVRAFLMIELYFIAKLTERKPDAVNIACSAAIITLLFRPFDLFDVGFQLSYTAVIGMALLYPEMKRHFLVWKHEDHPYLTRLAEALALSLAATIATMPVTVLQFHRLSIVGALANIPIIPLASVITSVGFLVVPLTRMYVSLGRMYGEALQWMTKLLLELTHLSAHMPRASIPASLNFGMGVILVAVACYYVVRAKSIARIPIRIATSAIGIWLMLAVLPVQASIVEDNPNLSMLFFDVGQGDCILLHTPKGHTYFIDFGGQSRNTFATAERTAVPFLQSEGIGSIDAGFLTHMHLDHFGGAEYVLQNESIGKFYWTGERVSGRTGVRLDSSVRNSLSSIQRVSAGDVLHLESDLTVYVLQPPKLLVDRRGPAWGENLNNGSLAMKVVYGKTSILLLGDIEGLDEGLLVRRYGDFLKSDVVKVAHHGSRASSTSTFVSAVSPKYAVVSVGERNKYGHPSALALHRWMHSQAIVLRTDRDGAVLLRSDGQRVWHEDWKN